ncbi:nucleoside-diphosphate kinase [Kibdelosporangium aridum]|uniref:Nucleoside-diphosphate kinase n=1 Tax=Kibdelosporangium aridum TaxID=2030 RepID=A0A428Z558_KIBAR|nr:nucleoside-diphosphate kinase [Kibdelosporangium aridum]RSM81959.1 nucleoside-diphosphate kinase [Kibdelosporangium aridum]
MTELSTMLSCDPVKRAVYASDTYFLESAEQLAELTDDVDGFATRHALLLLKPDAVITRGLLPALTWLGDNDFRVVAAARTRLDRTVVRALWYFQWNQATPHRRRLADLFAAASDSLVVIVRSLAEPEIPAAVRLTALKGPTDPDARVPGQLRFLLGRYSYLLNLVHTADEPADVVRELGVYFRYEERRRLVTAALHGADRTDRARELALDIYATTPQRDLTFGSSADRLSAELGKAVAGSRLAAQVATGLRDAMTRPLAWGELLRLAWREGIDLDPWDSAVVGASTLPMRRKEVPPLLAGVTAGQWRRHEAGSHGRTTHAG